LKRLAVAFTGPSNSGKTTLVVKIAKILKSQNFKVAIVKNDPKDKAKFDVEGKDSYKFFDTGAEVIVTSPKRTTYFSNETKTLDDIIKIFDNFDFLLVEGLKTLPLPRIAIFRDKIDESYLNCSNALAIDDSVNRENIPTDMKTLDLNEPELIVKWIMENAKEIE